MYNVLPLGEYDTEPLVDDDDDTKDRQPLDDEEYCIIVILGVTEYDLDKTTPPNRYKYSIVNHDGTPSIEAEIVTVTTNGVSLDLVPDTVSVNITIVALLDVVHCNVNDDAVYIADELSTTSIVIDDEEAV